MNPSNINTCYGLINYIRNRFSIIELWIAVRFYVLIWKKVTRVTCKFCEARSTSQKFTHAPVSFYFPINTKSVPLYKYL